MYSNYVIKSLFIKLTPINIKYAKKHSLNFNYKTTIYSYSCRRSVEVNKFWLYEILR